MCTLWQRLGRAARDPRLQAIAIIFVEDKFVESEEKDKAKAKKEEQKKRKAEGVPAGAPSTKRRATEDPASSTGQPLPVDISGAGPATICQESLQEKRRQLFEERRAQYASEARVKQHKEKQEQQKKKTKKRRKAAQTVDDLPLEITDVVNAGYRDIGCRREPFRLFFSSDLVGENRNAITCLIGNAQADHACDLIDTDHMLCDDTSSEGCPRCAPAQSPFCCDLHHPSRFQDLVPAPPKQPPKPRCSRFPKSYTRPSHASALHEELKTWRKDETRRRYGTARLRLIGASLVMTDEVLSRITDFCSKIKTVQDLWREVPEWTDLARYASEILALVAKHSPPPPSTTIPEAQAEPASSSRTAGGRARPAAVEGAVTTRVYHCGRCGQAGHNSARRS